MFTADYLVYAGVIAPVWLPPLILVMLIFVKPLRASHIVWLNSLTFVVAVGGTAYIYSLRVPSGLIYLYVLIPSWILLVSSLIATAIRIDFSSRSVKLAGFVAVAIGAALWARVEYEHWAARTEQRLALDFARSNTEITKAMGSEQRVVLRSSQPAAWLSGRYVFSIGVPLSKYAIVDVIRTSGTPEFTVVCIYQTNHVVSDTADHCKQ